LQLIFRKAQFTPLLSILILSSGSVMVAVLGADALENGLAGGLLPYLFFKSIFAEGQTD
jgi:hypothetical protein